MRRLWPLALLVILGAGLLGGRATSATSSPAPGEPFLPDLKTLDPSEFHVDDATESPRFLFLSNTIWNAGDGPLEMRPQHDEEADITYAYQLLFTEDSEGNLVQDGERAAGSFAFHASHNHWHFQDLARYSLVEMNSDGSKGEVLATSDKISFCMFDQRRIDGSLENAAPSAFYSGFSCDQNTNVGYSVGWGDEYQYNFADQDIDITGVPSGDYWVVSKADPERLIDETNNRNNGAKTAIRLTENSVRSITETTSEICRPCGRDELATGRRFKIKGQTGPAPGQNQAIDLYYRRRGTEAWKPFGSPGSADPFTLWNEADGPISSDGSWDRYFFAHKPGTWTVIAYYAGNQAFTSSSSEIKVVVRN